MVKPLTEFDVSLMKQRNWNTDMQMLLTEIERLRQANKIWKIVAKSWRARTIIRGIAISRLQEKIERLVSFYEERSQ